MNHLQNETEGVPAARALAGEVVEVASLVMRRVRAELRRQPAAGLSFTQTRTLALLRHSPGVSVSEVAEFLGLGIPTASKVIEELAQQGLVERATAAEDRRRVEVRATAAGLRSFTATVTPAYEGVAEALRGLTARERRTVTEAMRLLHPLLEPVGRGGDE